MATVKMTDKQMIEKLDQIKKGGKIRFNGKMYEVLLVEDLGGKLHRHDIALLEEGKVKTYSVAGKYLAAGKMIEMSNVEHVSWLARPSNMQFEIVDDVEQK